MEENEILIFDMSFEIAQSFMLRLPLLMRLVLSNLSRLSQETVINPDG